MINRCNRAIIAFSKFFPLKILLVAPCPKNNQRHDSMAIPQLTLSLLAGMTPEEHEVEIVYKGFNWEVTSYLSITLENIHDPERDCDCRIKSLPGKDRVS